MIRQVTTPGKAEAERLSALEQAAFPDRISTRRPEDFQHFTQLPGTLLLADAKLCLGFLLAQFAADEGEILDVGIHPAVRRQGAGRALLLAAITTARDLGAIRLVLEVDVRNQPARGLYESTGFTEAGVRKGYYRLPDGTRSDAAIMAMALGSTA